MRRALWETIVELAESVQPTGGAESLVRVTGLDIALPVEVAFRMSGDDLELLADVPRSRWRGGLDEMPSRMTLAFGLEDES